MGYLLPIPYIQEQNQYLRSKNVKFDPFVVERIPSLKLREERELSQNPSFSNSPQDKKVADLTGKGLFVDEFV
ncbi:hypothetical protein RZN22_03130 [Bacillaceae bacterium S4-13-58]